MLGQSHGHASRVRELLTAARDKVGSEFVPFTGPLVLEVEQRMTESVDPWDATNYLGGIADVLEVKDRRGSLPHLGPLAAVALYRNDRQIREVHYRQLEAPAASYRVRLWEIGLSADAWYPAIFERLSRLIREVPPLRDLLDFVVGASASLMRAEQLGFQEREFSLPPDYYEKLAERTTRMAHGTLPWHGLWISGYYFNSGLIRLWQTRDVMRDLLDKVRPRRELLKPDEDLKAEAERLKHEPLGLGPTRTVSQERAIELLEDLVSAIEQEKAALRELPVGGPRPGGRG